MAVLALQVLDEGINVLIFFLLLFYLLLGGQGSVRGFLIVKLAAGDVG